MASLLRYKCSNNECPFTVRLQTYFPIWKEGTPEALQRLPVNLQSKDYVEGHYDERVCLACRETVPVAQDDTKCPQCHAEAQFLALGGSCPICAVGRVVEDKERRVSF